MPAPLPALASDVQQAIEQHGPADIAVGILTYNNADTVAEVAMAAGLGAERHFAGARTVVVNVDADSSDGTRDRLAATGLPLVVARHDAPAPERVAVPFHGIPGRGAGLKLTLAIAHRLGVRALVLLEADVVSTDPDWMMRLAGPAVHDKVDLVSPLYARHRYDGTITKLLLSPLVRALYGRRLHQPFGGQQGLSARLVEHLLINPRWDTGGRDVTDLWMVGTTIADGFSVSETWLGAHAIRSRTRTSDLPTMVSQTLGAVFTLMDRHEDLWLEVTGSETVPALGDAVLPSCEPMNVDVSGMVHAFRRGLRDLTEIWELVLAPETLGDVLSLDVPDDAQFRFPDPLWARIVYDFALGHHYGVVHRDHLLRSLVPLYLGRTAAFVIATRDAGPETSADRVEAVSDCFEREKPYLIERWR
jgi:hypothetical protein